MEIRKLFLSKRAKAVVDILMLLTLILAAAFSNVHNISGNPWKSTHCIICLIWILLLSVHIAQHWKFIKSLTKKKIMQRNKVIVFLAIGFTLLVISVLLLTIGLNVVVFKLHALFGRLFIFALAIHIIYKFKRLLSLFRKDNVKNQLL